MKPQIREKNVFTSRAPIMILVPEHFQHLQRNCMPISSHPDFPLSQSLATPKSTSVFHNWKYKWPFNLASFILSSVLQNVRAAFLFICMIVYMYMTVGLGAYALTLMHRPEKNIECPAPSLWRILLRQDLSRNLELGWLAVSSPLAFVPDRT